MSESIPLEDSASEQMMRDFDVSTVPSILNATELDPIESIEESLEHNSCPTTSVLSSAPCGLLTPTMASGSNSGEMGGRSWADQKIFSRKKRIPKSWV